MRYLRLLFIYFEDVFEYKSRNLVWFLVSLVNPLFLLIFWLGYYKSQGIELTGIVSTTTTYYLLLVVIGALLTSHIETHVAYEDIMQGNLSTSLLRPYSYVLANLLNEVPWRIIQGFFGIIIFIGILFIYPNLIQLNLNPWVVFSSVAICIFAYILSFYFKMVVGLSALWLVEFSGLSQLLEVITLIFGGFIMPLDFFPTILRNISNILPFSYMTYYPIISLQGKLNFNQFIEVLLMQGVWLIIFVVLYKFLWLKGLKKFTGVGN